MTITLFGATGFIGKELVKFLIENNYSVNVVTRNSKKARKLFSPSVKIYGFEFGTLLDLINNTDTIINLAGENISSGLWTEKQKQRILSSRMNIGDLITQLCYKATKKPKLLIQASAIGYYGFNNELLLNEESLKGTGFLADVCEQWENSTQRVVDFKITRVVIRTGVVLGKNGGILPKLTLSFRFYFGLGLGSGLNYFSWIHILDEIRAIDFIINSEKPSDIFNLTSPNPIEMRCLNKSISERMNRPFLFSLPDKFIKFIFGDMAKEMLLANQRVLPNNLIIEGFIFNHETIDTALEDLIK